MDRTTIAIDLSALKLRRVGWLDRRQTDAKALAPTGRDRRSILARILERPGPRRATT